MRTSVVAVLVAVGCQSGSPPGSDVSVAERRPVDPAEVSGSGTADWMRLTYERVQAERLSPPVAARTYAYVALAMHEAVANRSEYGSLSSVLDDLPPPPPPRGGIDWAVAADVAAARVAIALFALPASDAEFQALLDERTAPVRKNTADQNRLERSIRYGELVATQILAWAATDGFAETRGMTYSPPTGDGMWVPTPPAFAPPLEPYWGTLRPFLAETSSCEAPDPVPFSTVPGSPFDAQAAAVHDMSIDPTDEQNAIAMFWADNPGVTGTPPGHWVWITADLVDEEHLSLAEAVEVQAAVGIALADAFVGCWRDKYEYDVLRPVTYIDAEMDPGWLPMLPTPPFPEYPSGHSVGSGAAAEVLTAWFGTRSFVDHTHDRHGLPARAFDSFEEAADEAAMSRLYGGIHYPMAIEGGLTQGECIGRSVVEDVLDR